MSIQTFFLSNRWRIFDGVWILLLTTYVLGGAIYVPFHGDESTHLYTSRDFADLFLEGNYSKIGYRPDPLNQLEQNLRLLNGSIFRYLAGASWSASGLTVTDLNEDWIWGRDYTYNVSVGHRPSDQLLAVTRPVSALMMAAGLIPLFACGLALAGRWAAYTASLSYALSPALLLNGRRAMLEGSMMLFGLLALWAAIGLTKRGFCWRDVIWLGLSVGAAVAAKHSNLIPMVGIFLGLGIIVIFSDGNNRRRAIRAVLGALSLSILMFYFLNPAWWTSPLETANEATLLRSGFIKLQSGVFGNYVNIAEKLTGFWRQAVVAHPMYFEADGWQDHIHSEILAYEGSFWRGVRLPTYFSLPLLLIGGYSLMRSSLQRRSDSISIVISTWALTTLGLTILSTHLEWQRYYLHVLLVWCVVYGAAVNQLAQWLRLTRCSSY